MCFVYVFSEQPSYVYIYTCFRAVSRAFIAGAVGKQEMPTPTAYRGTWSHLWFPWMSMVEPFLLKFLRKSESI